MPWITTKEGKKINTDWFDKDEKTKQRQIEGNKAEADKKNSKVSRLSKEAPEVDLRKELHSKLSTENDYTRGSEYQEKAKRLGDLWRRRDEIHKRNMELYEIEKKGSTIDEETLREFGGDRQLAALFATKNDEAKAAEQELKKLRAEELKLNDDLEKVQRELKSYEDKYVAQQKAAMKDDFVNDRLTMSTQVKDEYDGFEKDTHIPHYQRLYEKGEAIIVEMSPQEYLRRCAVDIFDSTYERQVRAVEADVKNTYNLADMMRSGTKMYMPMLNYEEKAQEGRHRAAAAILNGIERIPVMIVPKKRR